jgi:hypothetical protein
MLEMALALVLLVGSALFIRTSVALGTVDPGFKADGVLTMRMSLASPRFATANGGRAGGAAGDRAAAHDSWRAVRQRHVLRPARGRLRPAVRHRRPAAAGAESVPRRRIVGDRVGAVLRGVRHSRQARPRRSTSATIGSPPVVVISEAMAKQYWKDAIPLNDRLVIGRGVMREFADEPERQIIGIVGDVRNAGLERNPGPVMYIPQAQMTDWRQRPERQHHADGVDRSGPRCRAR